MLGKRISRFVPSLAGFTILATSTTAVFRASAMSDQYNCKTYCVAEQVWYGPQICPGNQVCCIKADCPAATFVVGCCDQGFYCSYGTDSQANLTVSCVANP